LRLQCRLGAIVEGGLLDQSRIDVPNRHQLTLTEHVQGRRDVAVKQALRLATVRLSQDCNKKAARRRPFG
jgi:hypothetical protein